MEALLFDELLDRLEAEHFTISVTHRLRVYQLALSLSEPVDLASLRTSLRPLLATSPDQQKTFDRVFEQYLRHSETKPVRATVPSIVAAAQSAVRSVAEAPRRTWMTAAAVAAVLSIGLILLFPDRTTDPSVDVPTDTVTTATAPVETIPLPEPTDTAPVEQPLEQPKPKEPPLHAALQSARTLLQGLGMILGAVLLFDLGRVAARWTLRRQSRGRKLPYRWPLTTADVADVFEIPAMDDAVRRLRRRATGERTQLDLEATIRATAAAGRFPMFVHAAARQSPRYVVLIERRAPGDQLCAYFRAMTDALSAREVELDVYEYDSDPRFCVDPRTGTRMGIGDIRERHPASRLLIMGSGEALADPFSGELRDWVETDLEWRVRGALLPEWTGAGAEHAIAPAMAVSRGDAEGLLLLADMLDRGDHARHGVSSFRDTLDTPLGSNPSVRELREILHPETFRWLTACAIHPELEWDITIRLGRLLLGTFDHRRLLELVRLRWFREGAIPDGRREELAEVFGSDRAFAQAHLAIAELLAERKPPPQTYAAEVHSMRAITHRILATPSDSPHLRPLVRELRHFSTALVRGNDDLVPVLTPAPAAPRLSAVVFRGGTPALGVRNFMWTATLGVLALLLAGSTVAAKAWSYANPPEVRRWEPPVVKTAEPVATPTPTPPIAAPRELYGPPAPVVAVLPSGCQARITSSLENSSWFVQFTRCGSAVVDIDVSWTFNAGYVWITFVPTVTPVGRIMLDVRTLTSASGRTSAGQIRGLPYPLRGTLEISKLRIPATLVAGEDVLGPRTRDPLAGDPTTELPCSGYLARASPDIWNAYIDTSCVGTIEGGMTGELVEGPDRIPVSVADPNPGADQVGNARVVPLIVKQGLGNTERMFTLQLGGRTYQLKHYAPFETLPVPERAELVIPTDGAELPLEEDQMVIFRWKSLRSREYQVSITCLGQTQLIKVSADTYIWTRPSIRLRGLSPVQCEWTVTPLPDGVGSIVRSFSIVERELLEVDWTDLGASVLVDGKIDGKVSRVTVNFTEVSVQNGRFRTDVKFGTGPLKIFTVATLPDGSEIVDMQTVPH